jgi:serine/threonine protein kinase
MKSDSNVRGTGEACVRVRGCQRVSLAVLIFACSFLPGAQPRYGYGNDGGALHWNEISAAPAWDNYPVRPAKTSLSVEEMYLRGAKILRVRVDTVWRFKTSVTSSGGEVPETMLALASSTKEATMRAPGSSLCDKIDNLMRSCWHASALQDGRSGVPNSVRCYWEPTQEDAVSCWCRICNFQQAIEICSLPDAFQSCDACQKGRSLQDWTSSRCSVGGALTVRSNILKGRNHIFDERWRGDVREVAQARLDMQALLHLQRKGNRQRENEGGRHAEEEIFPGSAIFGASIIIYTVAWRVRLQDVGAYRRTQLSAVFALAICGIIDRVPHVVGFASFVIFIVTTLYIAGVCQKSYIAGSCQNIIWEDKVYGDHLLEGGPPCEVPPNVLTRWTNNFNEENKIGEGEFSDVFEGIFGDMINQKQRRVAVKRLKPSVRLHGDETEHRAALSSIRREILVFSNFFHPNIIRLLGYTSAHANMETEICLVYELGECGSLDKMFIDAEKAQQVSWRARVRIATGVSRALNYLHCHDVQRPAFHRDVKSANIVLALDLSPKLIDCGLSTPGYMCPAYQLTGKYEAKSEIFSFGIVLLELLTGRLQGHQSLDKNDLYVIYIEEETALAGDLDVRAGTWSPECAEALEILARECLASHTKRIGTMLAVMRRLVEMDKEFCRATAEEARARSFEEVNLQCEVLQCEVEALRMQVAWQAEASSPVLGESVRTCNICFDMNVLGLACEGLSAHFICSDCAQLEVQRVMQAIQEPDPLERHRARGGRIKCVQPFCKALYDEPSLARVLSGNVFQQYRAAQDAIVEQRLFEQLQKCFQEQLAGVRAEFEHCKVALRTKQDAKATAEFMRRKYPNAVQCPRCGAGPVIPENCYDLQVHHGDRTRGGHISNACPACGFFSRDRRHWDRWNGQMR